MPPSATLQVRVSCNSFASKDFLWFAPIARSFGGPPMRLAIRKQAECGTIDRVRHESNSDRSRAAASIICWTAALAFYPLAPAARCCERWVL